MASVLLDKENVLVIIAQVNLRQGVIGMSRSGFEPPRACKQLYLLAGVI